VRLGLDERTVAALSAHNIRTGRDFFSLPVLDLSELLDLPIDQVLQLRRQIGAAIAPERQTAASFLLRPPADRFLVTGLATLDSALRGGFPLGGVTELVGPAGVGKTQFCLLAALHAVLPRACGGGMGAACIYIDTEKKFSPQRMEQMVTSRYPDFAHALKTSQGIQSVIESLGKRVLVHYPQSSGELLDNLNHLEAQIIDHGVRLVLVDSIASLVRSEYGKGQTVQRQEMLGQQAARLKFLAEKLQVAVVVTNQVTTKIQEGAGGDGGSTSSLGAALGVKWAHAVNTRLHLEIIEGERYVRVAKSPLCPHVLVPYLITALGPEPHPEREVLQGAQDGAIHDAAIRHELRYQ
jgi:RAD51-like protein 1